MANKVLVGQLVDYYWDLHDTVETIEMAGYLGSIQVVELRNRLYDLDKILTNISKRWAKGKRERIDK